MFLSFSLCVIPTEHAHAFLGNVLKKIGGGIKRGWDGFKEGTKKIFKGDFKGGVKEYGRGIKESTEKYGEATDEVLKKALGPSYTNVKKLIGLLNNIPKFEKTFSDFNELKDAYEDLFRTLMVGVFRITMAPLEGGVRGVADSFMNGAAEFGKIAGQTAQNVGTSFQLNGEQIVKELLPSYQNTMKRAFIDPIESIGQDLSTVAKNTVTQGGMIGEVVKNTTLLGPKIMGSTLTNKTVHQELKSLITDTLISVAGKKIPGSILDVITYILSRSGDFLGNDFLPVVNPNDETNPLKPLIDKVFTAVQNAAFSNAGGFNNGMYPPMQPPQGNMVGQQQRPVY